MENVVVNEYANTYMYIKIKCATITEESVILMSDTVMQCDEHV